MQIFSSEERKLQETKTPSTGNLLGAKVAYGYIKANDDKYTPLIDEEVAPIVVRIFEMFASGISTKNIAATLTLEGIPSPRQYAFDKLGFSKREQKERGIWCPTTISIMLKNIIYIGHLPQLKSSYISYKNHTRYKKDKSEWVIAYNNHEPIISQELWDKVQVRMKSFAQGRKTKIGFTHPLSGFLICADCGCKMKMNTTVHGTKRSYSFNCGDHMRYGKAVCFSHHIMAHDIEEIILDDIRTMAQRIVLDEEAIKKDFVQHNAELADKTVKTAKKELQTKKRRIEELSRLMQVAYEDRVKGKMPENLCLAFIQKYSDEQKILTVEIETLETKLTETESKQQSADDFIRDIKKYLNAPELTREMCYELLDRVVVGGLPKITGKERTIDIVYKVDIASVLRYKFR